MIRAIIFTLGLITAWAVVVVAVVAIEAGWFVEPDIVRGDFSSIQNHLDSRLQDAANSRSLGAASMALIHNGEIVFEKGYGVATADDSVRVDPARTLFQVGSVSKAVTAFGVMKLVQDKKIDLDQPVIGYLKRWRFDGADERRNLVTARQLLSHTAGIDDPSGYTGFATRERAGNLEDYLSGVRLSREPGTEFVYGNSASAILQLLIEEVTGQRFADYMAENVLRPLEMSNSTFDFDAAKRALAPAFDASVSPQEPRRHSIPAAVALYASGTDLGRFARALGGSNPVLDEATLQVMMRPVPASGGTWGLGLNLFTDNESGGHVIGHDGGAQPSWGAMVRFNPTTRNGMVVAVSGGRGAANMLSHDWVYWETGSITPEARRQLAYTRVRPAGIAIALGALVIGIVAFARYRAGRVTLSKR